MYVFMVTYMYICVPLLICMCVYIYVLLSVNLTFFQLVGRTCICWRMFRINCEHTHPLI